MVPAMSSQNPVSRRTFLALAGALPFAIQASAAQKKVPVGLELYSVRDALAKDLSGTVAAVAKLGYEVVEFYSPYFAWTPESAKDVRKLMDDLGIRCLSTHNSPAAIAPEGIQKAIEGITVWQAGCNHYYASASGRIVTQYPHSMTDFKNAAKGVDPSVFEVGVVAEARRVV